MSDLLEHRWFRWIVVVLAIFGAAAMLAYQRRTGPTYPIRVDRQIANPTGGKRRSDLPQLQAGQKLSIEQRLRFFRFSYLLLLGLY